MLVILSQSTLYYSRMDTRIVIYVVVIACLNGLVSAASTEAVTSSASSQSTVSQKTSLSVASISTPSTGASSDGTKSTPITTTSTPITCYSDECNKTSVEECMNGTNVGSLNEQLCNAGEQCAVQKENEIFKFSCQADCNKFKCCNKPKCQPELTPSGGSAALFSSVICLLGAVVINVLFV